MYTLFIDESGKNFLRNVEENRPHFSLAGVIIKNSDRQLIKTKADQIKFKYWGRTDVVFHTVDLLNLKGPFSIFKQVSVRLTIDDFYKDFLNFLKESDFQLSLFCMNRFNFIKHNHLESKIKGFHLQNKVDQTVIKGTEKGIIERYTLNILVSYLYYLRNQKSTGQVVIEATGTAQDLFVFKTYNNLLSNGYNGFKLSGEGIRKYFTSIAFVTKNNHDIETQLANCAGSFLNKSEREVDGIEQITSSCQQNIISILKSKSFKYSDTDNGVLKESINREC